MSIHPSIEKIAAEIVARSQNSRKQFLSDIAQMAAKGKQRSHLSCGNLAHGIAACNSEDKKTILDFTKANLAIVTAYNDMVSAHQPYALYPDKIKQTLRKSGHAAQVAGGVPAMCDGVTQGTDGMELSLFSRDLIAQATALSLSHNTYDGVLLLGICDKIAPGQVIGALSFGHLPTAFVPSGPMATGLSNDKKVEVRQRYAAGEASKQELQEMECQSYHSPGTCTFYGTANSNQLVLEAMGLMLPGSAFVHPQDPLRDALTAKISQHIAAASLHPDSNKSLAKVLDEKSLLNGLIALLASGGSTNHTIHLVALARAAGWIINWDDIDRLSDVVPLLTKMYPNGSSDINAFEQAGGVPALLHELHQRDLLFMDANPVYGTMQDYLSTPKLNAQGEVEYTPSTGSLNPEIIVAQGCEPFSAQGGLKLLSGNLGRGMMKVSAVAEQHQIITAPARVFDCQHDVEAAYKANQLNQDAVIVVRFNGPAANGMPELHKLMPILGNLMKKGYQVALVTDGRLSGASGKVPAVIHMSPEAYRGGPLAKIEDGDMIEVNGKTGEINLLIDVSERSPASAPTRPFTGMGRELFACYRRIISSAETGATIFNYED